jgi:N-acetylneuraminate synthase
MTTVSIGGRRVGDGEPCFCIAEAGSNHNGSLDMARRLIDVAVEAGADAVKFQLFRADRLYPRGAGRSEYLKLDRSIYDIIAEMEMPYEWIEPLAEHCRAGGVMFLASVFDEDAADRIERYVPAFKVASYEMTHIPLVRHLARKGKPLIISTGTAHLDEVRETVEEVRRTGNEDVILMQCTASYPAPLDALNVRAVQTLKQTFDVPAGLSDHSRDPIVGPVAAIALGANILEKHYTLDNDLPGPDHRFAVEPHELRAMIQAVRNTERALGTGEKAPLAIEQELRGFARRSVFALRDIDPDDVFSSANVAVLRCGNLGAGLPPREYPALLGRRAARRIPAESPIHAEDVR